ncbi:hypothetical protein DFH28DRAFT_930010 [Melampsora americana]|nr:hypothetical protein DFH28DRAFT_930010 [Melampsora americana]
MNDSTSGGKLSSKSSSFHNIYIDNFIRANSCISYDNRHRVMITSTFDVIASARPRFPFNVEPDFFHSTITTDGRGQGITQHALRGFPEDDKDVHIKVDGLYCLNGRLLGFNEHGLTMMMYQNNAHLLSRSLHLPLKDFANQVHVSSLGLVAELLGSTKGDVDVQDQIMVRHKDYDRINNRNVEFVIQYYMPQGKKRSHHPQAAKVGQKIFITGYLIGRNESTNIWIIQEVQEFAKDGPFAQLYESQMESRCISGAST